MPFFVSLLFRVCVCAGGLSEVLRKFQSLKRLHKSPLTSQGLTYMIRKFEATGILVIQPGKGRKCVAVQVMDDGATQVVEDG